MGGGGADTIRLFFNHYKTEDEAECKWNQRKKRIHWDNLFIIMSDQNGCTKEMAFEFDALPYKNKIFYSCREIKGIKSLRYIPDCGRGEIYTLTHYINVFGKRYFAYNFDWIEWINMGRH